MNEVHAKSFYAAYSSIDRFESIIFFHNYFFTFSLSILFSLFLPLIFLFLPSLIQTTRTIYFFLLVIICLANLFSIYIQMYFITNLGELNLSFHFCRFIVYISTWAKPMSIYLTFVFSIERFVKKILRIRFHPDLFRRFFQIIIYLTIILILAIRLYQIIRLLTLNSNQTDDNDNSTNRMLSFQYCFNSMQISVYSQILSFYLLQYWYEYILFSLIILLFLILLIYQIRFSPNQITLHTKFYFVLSISVILSESFFLITHLFIRNPNYVNKDIQLIFLQLFLFIFHFRCLCLPFIICYFQCYSLREFLWELFIEKPYLENINDEEILTNNFNSRTTNNELLDSHITQEDL